MEFEVYNKLNSDRKVYHESEPTILLDAEKGRIALTKKACSIMNLDKIKKCEFIRTNEGEWYISPIDKEDAFDVRDNSTGVGMQLNSVFIARKIVNTGRQKFRISTNPLEYEGQKFFMIIIQKPLYKR